MVFFLVSCKTKKVSDNQIFLYYYYLGEKLGLGRVQGLLSRCEVIVAFLLGRLLGLQLELLGREHVQYVADGERGTRQRDVDCAVDHVGEGLRAELADELEAELVGEVSGEERVDGVALLLVVASASEHLEDTVLGDIRLLLLLLLLLLAVTLGRSRRRVGVEEKHKLLEMRVEDGRVLVQEELYQAELGCGNKT